LQGIGNGILIHVVNGLPQAERATGADVIQGFAENVLIRDMGRTAAAAGPPKVA
jgi:hypothetical protein